MKKIKKNEEKKATISKATGWCPLLWHFLPGNNITPESKEIAIIIIIIMIIIVIIIIMAIIIITIIIIKIIIILQRLPIALAEAKADSLSKNLLNEKRWIVYSLYGAKEITKKYLII